MAIIRPRGNEELEFGQIILAVGTTRQQPRLPSPVHSGRPMAVVKDTSALPTGGGAVTYWAQMYGSWVDISKMVHSAQWRYGADGPQVAGLFRPADGVLQLNDTEGRWSPFNPHSQIDPSPGVPVEIRDGVDRQAALAFSGYSEGVTTRWMGQPETYYPQMKLAGPLKWYNEYGTGFASILNGEHTPAFIINQILDEIGFDGPRHLSASSQIQLFDSRVNSSSLLAQGRTRVKPNASFHELAIVEMGRLWDGPDGGIYYETYWDRDATNATVHAVDRPQEVQVEPPTAYVLNRVGARLDTYESVNDRDIYFEDIDFPIRVEVPPQSAEYTVVFDNIEWGSVGSLLGLTPGLPPDSFMDSWERPPVSYPHPWRWKGREQDILLAFENPTNQPQTAVVQQIRGNPLRRLTTAEYAARNARSIARYGPRSMVYPEEIIVQENVGRALIEKVVDEFGGIDGDGNAVPPVGIFLTLRSTNGLPGVYQVSELVSLTWEVRGKPHCQAWPFWIEGVEYQLNDDGSYDVRLRLLDAWRQGRADTVEVLDVAEEEFGSVAIDNAVEQEFGFIDLYSQASRLRFDTRFPAPLGYPYTTPPPPITNQIYWFISGGPLVHPLHGPGHQFVQYRVVGTPNWIDGPPGQLHPRGTPHYRRGRVTGPFYYGQLTGLLPNRRYEVRVHFDDATFPAHSTFVGTFSTTAFATPENEFGVVVVEAEFGAVPLELEFGQLPVEDEFGFVYVEQLIGDVPVEAEFGAVPVEDEFGVVWVEQLVGDVFVEVEFGDVFVPLAPPQTFAFNTAYATITYTLTGRVRVERGRQLRYLEIAAEVTNRADASRYNVRPFATQVRLDNGNIEGAFLFNAADPYPTSGSQAFLHTPNAMRTPAGQAPPAAQLGRIRLGYDVYDRHTFVTPVSESSPEAILMDWFEILNG